MLVKISSFDLFYIYIVREIFVFLPQFYTGSLDFVYKTTFQFLFDKTIMVYLHGHENDTKLFLFTVAKIVTIQRFQYFY